MRMAELAVFGMVLVAFAIGVCLYPQMPEQIASHWNAQGQVDGHMPRFWGVFQMPLISLGLAALFVLIPRIDPLKANIAKFRKYFDGFIIAIFLFLLYLYLLTLWWSAGARFNMIQLLAPAFGLLFWYCGILVENAKRNWFIGIKTPWTLSSDRVWEKTHKLGGKMFKAAGVLAILGTFFWQYAIWFVLVPVIVVAIYTIVYSYFEYQKEPKARGSRQ